MTDFLSSHQNIVFVGATVALVLSVLALIVATIVFVRIRKFNNQLKTLFAGRKGVDLQDIILGNNKKLQELDSDIQELFKISNIIHKQAHKSIHKIGLVRFNPFGERAGNQSFAAAILNSADNGIVISSLHTREGTRVYVKEINKKQPVNNELTTEEEQAINTAK